MRQGYRCTGGHLPAFSLLILLLPTPCRRKSCWFGLGWMGWAGPLLPSAPVPQGLSSWPRLFRPSLRAAHSSSLPAEPRWFRR